jgi:HSP20 family molecular chaperone IbpA
MKKTSLLSGQMNMEKARLARLIVSPAEIQEYLNTVFDLIARRAYEVFESRGGVHGHDWEDWFQAESEVLRPVTCELGDSGNALVAVAAVDDYRPEDLRISVEPRCLRICGLTVANDNRSDASEEEGQHFDRFFISLNLPTEIDTSGISADIKRGVLEVRLPKTLAA